MRGNGNVLLSDTDASPIILARALGIAPASRGAAAAEASRVAVGVAGFSPAASPTSLDWLVQGQRVTISRSQSTMNNPSARPAPHPSDLCDVGCPAATLRDGAAFLSAEAARLDRRGFLTQSMLAGASLALAACGAADAGRAFAPTSVGASIKAADYPALATVGGVALLSLNGAPIAVVRTATSNFIALSRACPHEGALVSVAGGGFTCPRHGAHFDTTGVWLNGQRTSSLRSYPTTYDAASGTVTIG